MAKKVKASKFDANGVRKFGIRDKLAYAAGDTACNFSFGLKSTVQTFWLVYMMMETGLLSILLLLVQAWDAINDPIIGAMIDADQRRYKRGKFKTYILIGAIGLIVGGAAVFLPFPNAPVVVKAALFIVGYVIWDAAYTMANVPYGSMLSLVTEDASERAQLSMFMKAENVNLDEYKTTMMAEINTAMPAYSKVNLIEVMEQPFEKTPKMSIKRFMYTKIVIDVTTMILQFRSFSNGIVNSFPTCCCRCVIMQ